MLYELLLLELSVSNYFSSWKLSLLYCFHYTKLIIRLDTRKKCNYQFLMMNTFTSLNLKPSSWKILSFLLCEMRFHHKANDHIYFCQWASASLPFRSTVCSFLKPSIIHTLILNLSIPYISSFSLNLHLACSQWLFYMLFLLLDLWVQSNKKELGNLPSFNLFTVILHWIYFSFFNIRLNFFILEAC